MGNCESRCEASRAPAATHSYRAVPAQMRGIHIFGSGKQPAISQAFTLHFQTEDHRMITGCRSSLRQVKGKAVFPTGRTGSDDVQISTLPSRSQFVQIGEPRGMPVMPSGYLPHESPLAPKCLPSVVPWCEDDLPFPYIPFKMVEQIVYASQCIRDVYGFIGSGSQLLSANR